MSSTPCTRCYVGLFVHRCHGWAPAVLIDHHFSRKGPACTFMVPAIQACWVSPAPHLLILELSCVFVWIIIMRVFALVPSSPRTQRRSLTSGLRTPSRGASLWKSLTFWVFWSLFFPPVERFMFFYFCTPNKRVFVLWTLVSYLHLGARQNQT